MTAKASRANVNIGFFGLLAIVFITLKLCGVINWSWVWVLSPLWVPITLILSIVVVIIGFAVAFEVITNRITTQTTFLPAIKRVTTPAKAEKKPKKVKSKPPQSTAKFDIDI